MSEDPRAPVGRAAVGARVRALREQRSLTLTALAASAGIGKATLSGLERGTRNATLETCYAICGALSVPITALLGAPSEMTGELRGRAVAARLLETFDDAEIVTEVFAITIAPGEVQRSPAHSGGVEEYLTVFRGEAAVGDPGHPVVLRAGEHGAFRADRPHVYRANGDEPVEAALVIRTPKRLV